MTVPFANLPNNTRNPGFYFEVDASQANNGVRQNRALLIGQATNTNVPQTAQLCSSPTYARTLAGAGSPLALMAKKYRERDIYGELWILPVTSNGAGTASTAAATITGPSTGAGTLNAYVCGVQVQVLVTSAMSAAAIATALAAAITANTELPVTAAAASAVVTCTAKVVGPLDIDLRFNYRGSLAAEAFPPGVGASVVITIGTGAPDMATALANLSDKPFDMIVVAYSDANTLDAIKSFLSDASGRWAPTRLLFGHGFAAMRGTLGTVTTALLTRNDQHMTVLPFNDSPTPAWLVATDLVGSIATPLRNDPGLPVQRIAMGWQAPPTESRYSFADRNVILYDGGSTFEVADDNTVITSRITTTYQKNISGALDDAYLDVETPFQLADVITFLQQNFSSVYARKKIVSDGTRLGFGNKDTLTPAIIRAYVLSLYRDLCARGRAQDADTFAKQLVVEYAGGGRVNLQLPITLAAQLRIIAGLVQFRKP